MIVLFDGMCNLCSASVQFIIERDRKRTFTFASLQSEAAKELLAERGLASPGDGAPEGEPESVLLVDGERVLARSSAALRIARELAFPWWLFYAFVVLPAFVRDPIYRFVARNRYRWFGRKEACWVPTAELRARFLK